MIADRNGLRFMAPASLREADVQVAQNQILGRRRCRTWFQAAPACLRPARAPPEPGARDPSLRLREEFRHGSRRIRTIREPQRSGVRPRPQTLGQRPRPAYGSTSSSAPRPQLSNVPASTLAAGEGPLPKLMLPAGLLEGKETCAVSVLSRSTRRASTDGRIDAYDDVSNPRVTDSDAGPTLE